MDWQRFFRRKRWDEERTRELGAYLEQETADVADLIRRLREEQPAPEPAEA